MKRLILCGALALVACKGRAAGPAPVAVPRTDDDKTFYSLGVMMGERLGEFNLSRTELEMVKRGLTDQVTGARRLVDVEQYTPRLREVAMSRQTARAESERRRGQQFAEQAAREPGAERLPSGVVFRQERPGTGPQPTADDRVTVNYRGTLIDGTEFDSSYSRNEPVTFPLRGVIPCWTEGVQRMHVGEKAKLVCPADTAYGDRAQRTIPPGSTLVFEIELLSIPSRPEQPAAAPAAPTPTPTP